jgi:peptidyl-prolyl cis-trans isomerase SurA
MCNRTLTGALAAFFMLLLALGAGALSAQPAAVDKVLAIVDDDVVLQSEFDDRWVQVEAQLAQAPGPLPPRDELRKQLLDALIIEHLQLQLAERAGVRVDDNLLNQTLTGIAQQNNLTFEQFRDVLDAQGLYQMTRETVRKEIIINQFQNGAVNRRINITRQEVENYLRSEAGLADIAPEYHVAHVLIPNNEQTPPQRQAELAQLLYQELLKGADIRRVAAAGQISGIQVSGGDLGFNKRENLPTLFRDIVPELQSGEITEPFTSPNGWHLVHLLETRGGSELKLNQARVRHILIKPNEIRTDQQAETLINQLYQRIQAGEDFADIARQNSDDNTSIVAGGNLDWINDGMLPEDFMAAVHAAPLGQIIPPFRASSGWHIIEVMERRLQDVTEDNKRFQVQNILRNRKFENELENWLTEIRDTHYIDIKDF